MKRKQIIGATAATLVAIGIVAACWAGVLDGTRGKVKVVPDKSAADRGEKEFDDTLSFADGKFSSAFFLAKGFKPAKYHGETEETEAEFEVEQTSATNGVINWLGEVRGKKLVGRLEWKKKKDDPALAYNFEGTKE